MACVSQLKKVLSRIGALDACIGLVLEAQADLVFQLLAKQVADAYMAGKVVAGRKFLVIGDEAVVDGIAHAQAGLQEPGRLALRGAPA